jgi:hypothetical protein
MSRIMINRYYGQWQSFHESDVPDDATIGVKHLTVIDMRLRLQES